MSESKTYSYFPGCTLRTAAKDLDKWARDSAKALGFTLEEIPDWQCCGGVYTEGVTETAPKLSSVRALKAANDAGNDLVAVCAACFNVLKRVENDMENDDSVASKRANAYMGEEEAYHGGTRVKHYLEVLRDDIGFEAIKAAVKNPLSSGRWAGKKIGAYYGCMLLRPSGVIGLDDAENPRILEDLIKALGGESVVYARRNECCGAYQAVTDSEIPKKRSGEILDNAKDNGATVLVTACPLCKYNLAKYAAGKDVEVVYFTELLAEALGVINA